MVETIQLLVVDDSALVRHGVRSALAPHAARTGISIVGEAATATEAVAECNRLRPQVVLMDVRLPDRSGIEACREILADPRAPRVLMLSSFADDDLIYEAMLAGAHGYLMKELVPASLADAIVATAENKPVITPEINALVVRVLRERSASPFEDRFATLSAQEKKILAGVAEGMTNKQIAERLQLSANTVRNYLVSVFEKLSVRKRSQAAALYVTRRVSKP